MKRGTLALLASFSLLAACSGAPAQSPTRAPSQVLLTTFGSDTRGVQTEVLTPAGTYRLDVKCDSGSVLVKVNVGRKPVKTFDATCGPLFSQEFDLSGSDPVEMNLEVETTSAVGEARLFRRVE